MLGGIARLIVLPCLACLCSCIPISSEKGILGRYELKSPDAKTQLDVVPDHSYFEIIRYTNGTEQRTAGAWHWMEEKDRWDPRVCFTSLLLPKQTGVMQNIFAGDSAPPDWVKSAGGAYQLDECAGPLKEYGRTILEIDPDSEQNFVRVSAQTFPHQ
jgi:hypothetical protein